MITKTSRSVPSGVTRQPIKSNTSITSGVRNRQTRPSTASVTFNDLTPSQQAFARRIEANCKKPSAIMGATNTSNIAARPDFLELLPLFVHKLHILDLFGSVAMKSRQQLVPYFKVMAENDKGETNAGDIFSSPMINRQGRDGNFTGRVVKNEVVLSESTSSATFAEGRLIYTPVLPSSVTITINDGSGDITTLTDGGDGVLYGEGDSGIGAIDYSSGTITLDDAVTIAAGGSVKASAYQYDNETVGPDSDGNYGAKMGKFYLQQAEFNLIAEAHQVACYWSIYAAFAAQQEYGGSIGDIAKEAAFSELIAEKNTAGFKALEDAARYKPQFNWDASPVLSGSVVPSDYLNMFKLKLGQAAASVYQRTGLSRPNRLSVGSNVAEYIAMINGFVADTAEDNVGPYKLGRLDKFEIYVEPQYDPNKWVMSCKSNDIRRNSGLLGEYMPLTETPAIGLANASVQQGFASMYALNVVNPDTVVSGKILGVF